MGACVNVDYPLCSVVSQITHSTESNLHDTNCSQFEQIFLDLTGVFVLLPGSGRSALSFYAFKIGAVRGGVASDSSAARIWASRESGRAAVISFAGRLH